MNIEDLSVTELRRELDKNDYIKANLNTNDKTISWDGTIEVYNTATNNHRKDDLLCLIYVQVKGHKSKKVYNEFIKYSISVDDLKNYLSIGGTIFFVVYISSDTDAMQIYYVSLLPYDLKRIIIKAGHSKTNSVKLKPFPKNQQEVSNLFLNYSKNMNKQRAAITADLSQVAEQLKSGRLKNLNFGFTDVAAKVDNPFAYMFRHEVYIYVKIPHGIELPVGRAQMKQAVRKVHASVTADGYQYYSSYEVIIKEDTVQFNVGKSIFLTFFIKDNKTSLKLSLHGTLAERIIDEKFILALSKGGHICIGTIDIPSYTLTEADKAKLNIVWYENNLKKLEEVAKLFGILNIKEELQMDDFTNTDERNLDVLMTAFFKKEPVPLNNVDYPIAILKIANLKFYLSILQYNNTKTYKLYNGICDKLKYTINLKDNNSVSYNASRYFILNEEQLLECCNLDCKEIFKSIKGQKTVNEIVVEYTIAFLLKVLNAYDDSKVIRKDLLKLAKNIVCWLEKYDTAVDFDVIELNKLQIIKRERDFNIDEKGKLYKIIFNTHEDRIRAGALLLLDEREEAKKHINKLSKDEQKEFEKYPIYHFMNKGVCDDKQKT